MGTSIYAWMVGAGLIFAILRIRASNRTAAIRAMAKRYGFVFLGTELPRSLTLRGTALDRSSSIWNVIDGERYGIRVVAFDCRIGSGKGSWRRTVIAAQSPSDLFNAVPFNRDLTVDRSGGWAILYQPWGYSVIPPGLMSIAELEAHLEALEH